MQFPPIIIPLLLATLIALGASSTSAQHNTNDNFLQCLIYQFRSSNLQTDGVINTPRNASYATLLLSQNQRPQYISSATPQLIITPFHESEIQAAVHCSRQLGLQIRVRSGGHDYEGLSYTSRAGDDPFLIIDMRNMRAVTISHDAKTAWAEVGATLGQLYYTLAQRSNTLGFPAGICPTVGVGGHFSGGGYGMMARKNALAADNVIDAKLINVHGQILNRKSMGEDLFWAIRGGGGSSFGIVIAFRVELVTVPETVTVFNVTRTLAQNATQLVHKWQHIADNLDRNLLITVFMRSARSPMSGNNRTIHAFFTSLFLGRAHDLLPIMQREFPELGLVEQDCIEMRWIESVQFFWRLRGLPLEVLLDRTPQSGQYYKGKSDYVRQPISVQGLRGMWRFLNEEVENTAEVQFSPYGGILSTISESEIAFPHRSGRFIIHYGLPWRQSAETERHLNWMRRLYSYMTRYVSKNPRTAYINYRDLDIGMNSGRNTTYEQASVWGLSYFDINFNRLARVKGMVDPTNFFRNEQSIPPLTLSS